MRDFAGRPSEAAGGRVMPAPGGLDVLDAADGLLAWVLTPFNRAGAGRIVAAGRSWTVRATDKRARRLTISEDGLDTGAGAAAPRVAGDPPRAVGGGAAAVAELTANRPRATIQPAGGRPELHLRRRGVLMTTTWTLAPADGEPLATFTGRRGAETELLRFELAARGDSRLDLLLPFALWLAAARDRADGRSSDGGGWADGGGEGGGGDGGGGD